MLHAFRRLVSQPQSTPAVRPARLNIEMLEAREVPANFLVTNLNDSGGGSLRQAVIDANGAGTVDVIQFQAGLTGTITLTTGEIAVTDEVDIQGPGSADITVSGNNASRIFNTSDITSISGLTLTGGNAAGDGGAILAGANLTLTGMVVTGNNASNNGGGISDTTASGNNFSLINSQVTGNTASGQGGGVYLYFFNTGLVQGSTISGNTAGSNGGGIYFYGNATTFTFDASTISGNTSGGAGGGIFLGDDDVYAGAAFQITGTTISGNTAATRGGAIDAQSGALDHFFIMENSTVSGNTVNNGQASAIYLSPGTAGTTIRNSTIAGNNTVAGAGGAVVHSGGSNLTVTNSILADSDDPGANSDLRRLGGIVNASFSLFESLPAGTINGTNTSNITATDPLLGPLANNGGTTLTHLPQFGSPVIDTGNPAFVPPPATDQRGQPRVVNGRIDMGSVETAVGVDNTAPTAVLGTAANVNDASPASTYSFTVVVSDNVAVDSATFGNANIRVTGPNGFNQLATFVSSVPAGNGTPRTATYSIVPPGGTWDSGDNGLYSIAVEANQIEDLSNNAVAAGPLGSFTVSRSGPVVPPPVAEIICEDGEAPNSCYVKRLYVDLLGRKVDNDPAGQLYIGQLDEGRSRQSVVDEIVHSPEYAAARIRALYLSVLGREADAQGLAGYVQGVVDGDFSLEDVQVDMIASDEFRNAYPANELEKAILAAIPGGTPPSPAGPLNTADEVREFAQFTSRTTDAVIARLTAAYDELLHRGLDQKAYDWETTARESSITSVIAFIAASDEYYNDGEEII